MDSAEDYNPWIRDTIRPPDRQDPCENRGNKTSERKETEVL